MILPAAACSPSIVIGLVDDAGQPTSGTTPVAVNVSAVSTGPVDLFSDTSCATALSALSIPAGATSASFAFRGHTAGRVTVTASSPPLLSATQRETLTDALAASLVFTTPPRTTPAGVCSSALSVELRDALGAPALSALTAAYSVSVKPDAGLQVFSDGLCSSSAASVVIDAGSTSGTFFLQGTSAGPKVVSVDGGALGVASQSQIITAASPVALRFTSAPQALEVLVCSSPVSLEPVDVYGNSATVASATSLALSASPPTGLGFFSDSTCDSGTGTTLLDAGAGSASFFFTASRSGPVTLTADGGPVLGLASQLQTLSLPWPFGFTVRRQLLITAGPNRPSGGYAGYTYTAVLDTSADIDAGAMRSDCRDLRVMRWTGTTWQELDRELLSPNSASTTLRFRSQADLAADASTTDYSLFSNLPDAGAPPADPDNVYLFADDFESGALGKWTIRNGVWAAATDRARSGTTSLKYPPETSGDRVIQPAATISEADVLFEASWSLGATANNDFSQLVRLQPGPTINEYETNLEGTTGWNLSKMIGGAWTELLPNAGVPSATGWTRIGVAIVGTKMRLFKDGVQIIPASGTLDVSNQLGAGTVGFRKWNIGPLSSVWIDDVTLRRLADPEPTVVVGPAVLHP